MEEPNRLLALAVTSGRVGAVFFIGPKLLDWRMSEKAARGMAEAAEYVSRLIEELSPNVVVTERIDRVRNKGSNTKELIEGMALAASESETLDLVVERPWRFKNKYDEIEALTERYPDLGKWKPKRRRFFDNEPRNTVLFEALVLADEVLVGR